MEGTPAAQKRGCRESQKWVVSAIFPEPAQLIKKEAPQKRSSFHKAGCSRSVRRGDRFGKERAKISEKRVQRKIRHRQDRERTPKEIGAVTAAQSPSLVCTLTS